MISALCRSYLLHRLLKGFVSNIWLRLLIEAVLVPAVVDSRLPTWAREVLRETRTRAQRLQEQAQVVVDLERQQPTRQAQLLLPVDLPDLPAAAGLEHAHLPDPAREVPAPGNTICSSRPVPVTPSWSGDWAASGAACVT